MFNQLQWPGRRRWHRALLLSFAVHCVIVFLWVEGHGPAALLTPSDVALGIRGSSGSVSIVYLAPVGAEQAAPAQQEERPALRAALVARPRPPEKKPPREQAKSDGSFQQAVQGGSPFGRVPGSPITGDEVVPALPEVFPDPPVSRADIPAGVEGDVIVEVTIDPQGNVVDMKLLQGIGYGIEQKVLAVLEHWRFRPAMRDGVTIASQHIVHFHYPS